jgi:hypothetical protein
VPLTLWDVGIWQTRFDFDTLRWTESPAERDSECQRPALYEDLLLHEGIETGQLAQGLQGSSCDVTPDRCHAPVKGADGVKNASRVLLIVLVGRFIQHHLALDLGMVDYDAADELWQVRSGHEADGS